MGTRFLLNPVFNSEVYTVYHHEPDTCVTSFAFTKELLDGTLGDVEDPELQEGSYAYGFWWVAAAHAIY